MSSVEGDEIISSSTQADSNGKVVFLLKAAGGAPILRKKRWELPRTKTLGYIKEFLKKHMQLDNDQQQQLLLYVNQAFAPANDTTIGAVYDCFCTEGPLVLNYTLTPAWG